RGCTEYLDSKGTDRSDLVATYSSPAPRCGSASPACVVGADLPQSRRSLPFLSRRPPVHAAGVQSESDQCASSTVDCPALLHSTSREFGINSPAAFCHRGWPVRVVHVQVAGHHCRSKSSLDCIGARLVVTDACVAGRRSSAVLAPAHAGCGGSLLLGAR